jgi:hypothetical protein
VWRATSANQDALETLRSIYGGKIKRTSNSKAIHPWELRTESDVLRVLLAPDPLGDTPTYEKFGGRGRERSCDGQRCLQTTEQKGPDGGFVDSWVDCICFPLMEEAAKRGQAVPRNAVCSVTTRLSVMFEELPFGGTWTVKTGSEFAAREIPGMVELIRSTGGAMARVELRITKRAARGGAKQFNVPVIHPTETLVGLTAGAGRLGSPAATEAPALGAGSGPALPAGDARAKAKERLRALKANSDDPDSEAWEDWQTFLRVREERGWPAKIDEMSAAQFDDLELLLDDLEV